MADWNPWHGCQKYSEGCAHCYVYRSDARYGRDSAVVQKTVNFDLPLRKGRNGQYKIPPGEMVFTCFSSDFLLADADDWRGEAWEMMRARNDLQFLFITKRITRLAECLPAGWTSDFGHVTVCCTCENQRRAAERLPVYLELPLRRRIIICEPLLEAVDLAPYLGPWIEHVVVGGESGPDARECHYEWVLALREQCEQRGVGFHFKQTGANFVRDGRRYFVPRREQHRQAQKSGISTVGLQGEAL